MNNLSISERARLKRNHGIIVCRECEEWPTAWIATGIASSTRLNISRSAPSPRLHGGCGSGSWGCVMPKKIKRWTSAEEQTLRDMWAAEHTVSAIAKKLKRTRASVSGRLAKLGLFGGRMAPRKVWSREEIDFLLAHYRKPGWTAAKIADHLGRSASTVYEKARYFGAADPDTDYKTKPREIDQKIITLAMADTSTSEIAERLGCSAGYVWKVMKARPALHKRWKQREARRRADAMARAHAEGRHPGPTWRKQA